MNRTSSGYASTSLLMRMYGGLPITASNPRRSSGTALPRIVGNSASQSKTLMR